MPTKPVPPASQSLADYIRDQVSNALRRARGDMSVPALPDPSIGFIDLPAQATSIGIFARSCAECRALVLRTDETTHAEWHREVLRTISDPPALTIEPVKGVPSNALGDYGAG